MATYVSYRCQVCGRRVENIMSEGRRGYEKHLQECTAKQAKKEQEADEQREAEKPYEENEKPHRSTRKRKHKDAEHEGGTADREVENKETE